MHKRRTEEGNRTARYALPIARFPFYRSTTTTTATTAKATTTTTPKSAAALSSAASHIYVKVKN
jgi:hypothetical protein